MSAEDLKEMGPVDYVVVEWPGKQPTGRSGAAAARSGRPRADPHPRPRLHRKGEDGSVAGVEISDLGTELEVFEELPRGCWPMRTSRQPEALEPGTSAALLVYENVWAAPFATAVRKSGGQLVASGRIPVQAIVAALDAAEA